MEQLIRVVPQIFSSSPDTGPGFSQTNSRSQHRNEGTNLSRMPSFPSMILIRKNWRSILLHSPRVSSFKCSGLCVNTILPSSRYMCLLGVVRTRVPPVLRTPRIPSRVAFCSSFVRCSMTSSSRMESKLSGLKGRWVHDAQMTRILLSSHLHILSRLIEGSRLTAGRPFSRIFLDQIPRPHPQSSVSPRTGSSIFLTNHPWDGMQPSSYDHLLRSIVDMAGFHLSLGPEVSRPEP